MIHTHHIKLVPQQFLFSLYLSILMVILIVYMKNNFAFIKAKTLPKIKNLTI